jgi:hypothetical protein
VIFVPFVVKDKPFLLAKDKSILGKNSLSRQ